MKAYCFMYKKNNILQWLKMTIEKKGKRQVEKKKKKQQKKEMIKILKLRVLQSEFAHDGEKWKTEVENEAISDYIGPGQPKPFNKYRQDPFRWIE